MGHVPDALLQLVAAHRAAGVLREHEEQAELGRRQLRVGARALLPEQERALLIGW